ncbi:MAG: hypothetical protein APZ16_01065 [Candidatus Hadarchaeum yellowstonense]|jgi:hypothetical protein|uniref:Uncharacterized protein n=1 Tax=Hadarchaeum yellowstonense TaxID=1776334 RepID=A0A147JWE3_HADYE|nr:MAG: hypothetical protein APZ16_01065 [Candidatus Hadarchaeum yellowstonense]
MNVTAKLTLAFSGAGAIAGIISAFLPNAWLALLVAFIFLYLSYKLTTYFLKRSAAPPAAAQAPGQPPTPAPVQPAPGRATLKGFRLFFATLVTKGSPGEKDTEAKFWFWPYYFMWFILWVMVYTIMLLW